jgi:hypothetical protein
MATTSLSYTDWASVGSSSALDTLAGAAYWGSIEVDNGTNAYVDALVGGKIVFGASHVAGDTCNVYVTGNYDTATATAWGGGIGTALNLASGTDGNTVLTVDTEHNEVNLILLGVVECSAASSTEHFGPWSVGAAFGGMLPQKYAFVIQNVDATAALGSTHALGIVGVKYTSA